MAYDQLSIPKRLRVEQVSQLELQQIDFRHTRGDTMVYVIREKFRPVTEGRFFLTKLVADKTLKEALWPGSRSGEVNPLFYGRTYDDMLAFFERQISVKFG